MAGVKHAGVAHASVMSFKKRGKKNGVAGPTQAGNSITACTEGEREWKNKRVPSQTCCLPLGNANDANANDANAAAAAAAGDE